MIDGYSLEIYRSQTNYTNLLTRIISHAYHVIICKTYPTYIYIYIYIHNIYHVQFDFYYPLQEIVPLDQGKSQQEKEKESKVI